MRKRIFIYLIPKPQGERNLPPVSSNYRFVPLRTICGTILSFELLFLPNLFIYLQSYEPFFFFALLLLQFFRSSLPSLLPFLKSLLCLSLLLSRPISASFFSFGLLALFLLFQLIHTASYGSNFSKREELGLTRVFLVKKPSGTPEP
ncbi:hypothetical protein DM02DRAFT_388045 [Periconia macrospinosa]|uniref:Uncharacterized protein n=1 Tax=Periconia macrospinosa TaxID=97972 RepID=A0A2V1CZ42_9PLEO|nr:hypothetical protein DM02DRAFT_388045 [Periconia macrospinosa]